MPREGMLISNPLERITSEQVRQVHVASLQILNDPGLLCFNQKAAEIFHSHNAGVTSISDSDTPCWHVKIPEKLKAKILATIPSKQRELSIEHQRKWYLAPQNFVATAAAAIFIFISMLMVSYGLPNPPQKMLTNASEKMWIFIL